MEGGKRDSWLNEQNQGVAMKIWSGEDCIIFLGVMADHRFSTRLEVRFLKREVLSRCLHCCVVDSISALTELILGELH